MITSSSISAGAAPRFRILLRFGVLFMLALAVWAVLSRGAPDGWVLGIPAALIYAALLTRSGPLRMPGLRPVALLRFVMYFVYQSLISGTDVAWRALSIRMPLDPVIVTYRTRLPPGAARAVFANFISLLPGTLTCGLEDDAFQVHALVDQDVTRSLADLERRIAAVLGVTLEPGV